MTLSEELNALIEIIPIEKRLAHINDFINDLNNFKLFSVELEKKSHIALNFLSVGKKSLYNERLLKELVETSFNYLLSDLKNNFSAFNLLSKVIALSITHIKDQSSINACFLKHLNSISGLFLTAKKTEVNDKEILGCAYIFDVIVESIRHQEFYINSLDSELVTTSENLFELSFIASTDILNQTLVIIKKLCKFAKNSDLLFKVWKLIKIKKNAKDTGCHEFLGYSLSALCFLAEYFIVDTETVTGYPLCSDNELWEIIQTGLTDSAHLKRKQSLYLLKSYITVLDSSNHALTSQLFCWNFSHKKEMLEYWNSYFIIWEALEEKQIHLIMPSLVKFDTIIELTSKQVVDSSWMFCLFSFCFSSESVVVLKQSIVTFFSIDLTLFVNNYKFQSTIIYLFKALNNMMLFTSNEWDLRKYLEEWLKIMASKCTQSYKLENLLQVVSEMVPSYVPLFYIINGIIQISWDIAWNSSLLKIIKNIILSAIGGQNVKIRGAIQNMVVVLVTNHPCHKNVTLEDLADLFATLSINESFKRGTICWARVCSWIQVWTNKADVLLFLKDNYKQFTFQNESSKISHEALARISILMEDANMMSDSEALELYQNIFDHFTGCDKRAYVNQDLQNLSFCFINYLLIEGISYKSEKHEFNRVVHLIKEQLPSLISFIGLKMESVFNLEDVNMVDVYLNFFNLILCHYCLFGNITQNLMSLHYKAIILLKSKEVIPIQEYFSLKIEYYFHKHHLLFKKSGSTSMLVSGDMFIELYQNRLLKKSLIREEVLNLSLNMERLGGYLVSRSIQSVWMLFYCFISSDEANIHFILERIRLEDILKEGVEALNTGGKEILICILKVFKLLLPNSNDSEFSIQIFSTTWEACFEHRKTELFWKSFHCWIMCVFQRSILGDFKFHSILIDVNILSYF